MQPLNTMSLSISQEDSSNSSTQTPLWRDVCPERLTRSEHPVPGRKPCWWRCLDNLGKGASGAAAQNVDVMLGLSGNHEYAYLD